mgnify:CR=1 FL=1
MELNEKEKELLKTIEQKMAEQTNGFAKTEEIQKQMAELKSLIEAKDLEGVQKRLDEIDIKMKEKKPEVSTKSFDEQLKEKMMSSFDDIKAGRTVNFEVGGDIRQKAAATMTIGTSVTGDVPRKVKLPDFFAPAGNGLWASGLIQEIPATGNSVSITELYDEQGAPVFHDESHSSALMSWSWREKNFKVKDVSAYAKFSKNMLDDIDNFIMQLQNLLMNRVAIKMDAAMISGNETTYPEQFNGLATIATPWAAGGKVTYKPNEKDVIEVAIGLSQSNNGYPNAIVINPSDLVNLKIAKAGKENAILQYPGFDGTISGLNTIVSNQITAGKFLVLDSNKAKLHVRTPYEITISNSANDGDFTKRLITVSITKRCTLVISANDYGSVVYGDFTTAKTALTLTT